MDINEVIRALRLAYMHISVNIVQSISSDTYTTAKLCYMLSHYFNNTKIYIFCRRLEEHAGYLREANEGYQRGKK